MVFSSPSREIPYSICFQVFSVRRMFRTVEVRHLLKRIAPSKIRVERFINGKRTTKVFKTDLPDHILEQLFIQAVGYIHQGMLNGRRSLDLSFFSHLAGSYAPPMKECIPVMPEL